jgi:transketolase
MNSIYPSIRAAKLRLLAMHHSANAGHIGGNLSCIDALMVLYHSVLGPEDRFVLSKGHSAGALYVALWSVGRLSDADLETFGRDDTLLPGHPTGRGIPGLLFSTGSLGHGPSMAVGLAMAARYQHSNRRVYCLCSDGEWQEGSCWEALSFAVHQRLDNLTILVDQNGLQGFGTTEEVASCSDLSPRLAAFGPEVESIDGHDPVAIEASLRASPEGRPKILVLNTIKGHGLHFAGRVESHYLPLTEDQYSAARAGILEDRA